MTTALKTLGLHSLNVALQLLLGALWRVVKQQAEAYELTDLSGPEKRELVFASLCKEAQVLGIDISRSLINLGIEAAVQWVRAKSHG